MTGSSINAVDTLSSSSQQQIRPMIETVPLAPKAFGAAEAYERMMRNEARFRIVLVTGSNVRFRVKESRGPDLGAIIFD